MSQTTISVWFVCKLCRGSFGQVDAFIEHKKQKHFNEFQNTTSIVFEETEHGLLCPVITNNGEHQLADESYERPIKIEVNDEDPIDPVSSEIFDNPNLALVEPKSELITYETEINPDTEKNFFGLRQSQQNPYVLLKRLTSEEIQSACVPKHDYRLLKCEQQNLVNSSEPRNSFETDSNSNDHDAVENTTEVQSAKSDILFECKLCTNQLESIAKLKIHVGICALYHEDRKRFCVICNRKFSDAHSLKQHCLRFHWTEEEKSSSSWYKFKCDVCLKLFRETTHFLIHMESHEKKKQVKTSKLKCSHPNCGKEFPFNSDLQGHIATVHLELRPFNCHFPKCNKTFKYRSNLINHFHTHTGERPFKCTVKNCTTTFFTLSQRSKHHKRVHCK